MNGSVDVATEGFANGGLVFDLWHLHRSGGGHSIIERLPVKKLFCLQLSDGPADAPADLLDEASWHRQTPGEGSFGLAEDLRVFAEAGVRTRVGPELYRKGFSERDPQVVAKELMAATLRVLGRG